MLLGSLFRSYSLGDALLADVAEIKRTLQFGLYRTFFFLCGTVSEEDMRWGSNAII